MSAPWPERRDASERAYRSDPDRFSGEPSAFARWALSRLQGHPGRREIVELGAGVGRDARYFVAEGFKVRSVEFAPTAVERSLELRRLLREPTRSRWTVGEGEALAFLKALPPGSADAVYAHLVYATLGPAELAELIRAVHSVLRPGGLHLYCVRDITDPNFGQGQEVGPKMFLGGPHEVPYRYFGPADLEGFRVSGLKPWEAIQPKGLHQLYVADQNGPAPPLPSVAPSRAAGTEHKTF